ncbi:hypothetical protein AYO44_10400 [Planctomycetaceae bacterium SCGC AG-212-F19]|nr:hypothetical protein AYO44_10400 [Planctomycetaceae bacterium SCGC AG-212-F19]
MTTCRVLLFGLLLCTGCVHLPTGEPERKPDAAPQVATPRPVTADQITPDNARTMVDVLRQELDKAGN